MNKKGMLRSWPGWFWIWILLVRAVCGPVVGATVSLTNAPVADAYVWKNTPTSSYGTLPYLRVRTHATLEAHSFLRFWVKGPGKVLSAKLRLHVNSNAIANVTVQSVGDISWTESGVTWSNQPALGATVATRSSSLSAWQWYELDVSSAVTNWGFYSFGLTSTDTGSYKDFDARESADPPVLVVTYDGAARAVQPLSALEIFQANCQPQGVFFRTSEGQAKNGPPYAGWDAQFSELQGIIGKVLDEQGSGHFPYCEQYFTQYKLTHPEKAAIIHISGNARDMSQLWEVQNFFPGHWVYEQGQRVATNVAAGDTNLFVVDANYFAANEPAGIFVLTNNAIDWSQCEFVQIASVDPTNRLLGILRGQFNTPARAFGSNQAYIAALDTTVDPQTFRYNFALSCPRDSAGSNCIDRLIENFQHWFAPGGYLEGMNGVEFDVDLYSEEEAYHASGWRHVDVNGDMLPDAGFFNGTNDYALGKIEFQRRLRALMGPNRLIMGDIQGSGFQRSAWIYNGGESESFPSNNDRNTLRKWSTGANRFHYWLNNSAAPRFCYARVNQDDFTNQPIREMRFQNGGLQILSGAPAVEPLTPDNRALDELVNGTAQQLNWLGYPVNAAVQLSVQSADLLNGSGVRLDAAFANSWKSDDAVIAKLGSELRVAGTAATNPTMTLTLTNLSLPAGSVVVAFDHRGEPLLNFPPQVPRLLWTHLDEARNLTVQPLAAANFTYSLKGTSNVPMAIMDPGAEPMELVAPNLQNYADARWVYSSQGTVGYWGYMVTYPSFSAADTPLVAWQKTVKVPASPCELRYLYCADSNPWRSGLGFSKFEVFVNGLSKGAVTSNSRYWRTNTISLSSYAGQTVTLRFEASPATGYNGGNAVWGPAWLTPTSQPSYARPDEAADALLTYVSSNAMPSTFYFRAIATGSNAFNLTLSIEGAAPVYLSNFRIYSAEDAWVREYQNGAVLLNPSRTNYPFNLAALFPGKSFRRLQGTPNQDPVLNDGSAVGATVSVSAEDALFLAKTGDVNANDADRDGLPDAWEIAQFGDLTTANATTDFDGDGFSDLVEFRWGTNPKDAASQPQIRLSLQPAANGVAQLRWACTSNILYDVLQTSNAAAASWSAVATNLPGNLPATSFPIPTTNRMMWYRVIGR